MKNDDKNLYKVIIIANGAEAFENVLSKIEVKSIYSKLLNLWRK